MLAFWNLNIPHPSFLRRTPFRSGQREPFKPHRDDEREWEPSYPTIRPPRCDPNAPHPSSLDTPSKTLDQVKANAYIKAAQGALFRCAVEF
jgi:hypothetical protein